MKLLTRIATLLGVFAVVTSVSFLAQGPPPGPDMTIDAATRSAVIDGALKELGDFYVFPDVAARMTAAIREHQQRREYDGITSARQLAESLTRDLRAVSADKHLGVNYSVNMLPPLPYPPPPPSAEQIERSRTAMAQTNFGFEKVERLAGNIGYIDMRAFLPPNLSGDTVAAAMTFVANTDALIIDLRQNGGGSPDGVALLASYLFDRPVRMNDIYDRPSNETRQFWTMAYVPGKRIVGKDVYVLTSNRTFSAAEDFTYGVKNLERATIVGEVTGGGAHPVGPRRINDHFVIVVPMGRSLSAITHTDWEGTGVEPDVKVPASRALATAHLKALEKRASSALDPPMRAEIADSMARLRKELAER
jgi:hypothetical protein